MIFRISVAAELALFALAKSAQTASPSQDCRPLGRPWDSRNAQAPLAKTSIRSKTEQIRYYIINFRVFAGACIRNFLATRFKLSLQGFTPSGRIETHCVSLYGNEA